MKSVTVYVILESEKECHRKTAGPVMKKLKEIAAQLTRPGRLFLCLMIIVTPDGVSEAKATNTKAEHCNKSFNRQHKRRPPFQYFRSKTDYVNGGSQSLRRGLTAYHPGSPNEILPQFDRNFNQILFSWNMWKVFQNQSQNNLTEQKKRPKSADFTHFSVQMSVIRTRLFLTDFV